MKINLQKLLWREEMLDNKMVQLTSKKHRCRIGGRSEEEKKQQ
jgi:hypothetical protein